MGFICLYVLIQKSGQKTAKSHLCTLVPILVRQEMLPTFQTNGILSYFQTQSKLQRIMLPRQKTYFLFVWSLQSRKQNSMVLITMMTPHNEIYSIFTIRHFTLSVLRIFVHSVSCHFSCYFTCQKIMQLKFFHEIVTYTSKLLSFDNFFPMYS